MRKIYADGSWLHYPPLEFYYIQGEENVEAVQFVLLKNREEVDLTPLSYQIKAVSETGTEAVWILPKKLTDEHILLNWEITREFTAIPGRVTLTLTGTDSNNHIVAKWTGEPAIIRADPHGTAPVPPPDKIEQFEKQVNESVERIIKALENADGTLEGTLSALEEAKRIARNLIAKSDELKRTINVLETRTIPNFTAYVDSQKNSIDTAAQNVQNAAKTAQISASAAETSRHQAEQIQQNIVTESQSVAQKYKAVQEMTGRVEAATKKAEENSGIALGAANTAGSHAKSAEQFKNTASAKAKESADAVVETRKDVKKTQEYANTASQKAIESYESAQAAATSEQSAQQAKTEALESKKSAAASASDAQKSAQSAAQSEEKVLTAIQKELISLTVDAEGWTEVSGQENLFSHPLVHNQIGANSYVTLNPGNDNFFSELISVGYAGGYIKNEDGAVTWVIKADKKPDIVLSVQITLEKAKEGSGIIYTGLNTGIGSNGGFVIKDTQPEKTNLLWIQPNGLTKFWNGSDWTAISGVYAEEVK